MMFNYRNRMKFLVKNIEVFVWGSVFDVEVNGKGDALDSALEIGLRDSAVVQEYRRARGALLHWPRLKQLKNKMKF
jgi:hypothetical protein